MYRFRHRLSGTQSNVFLRYESRYREGSKICALISSSFDNDVACWFRKFEVVFDCATHAGTDVDPSQAR